MSDFPKGRFTWYDLMTSDPEKAAEFYTELVGWGTQDWEGDQPYTMWTNGDTTIGGVAQLPQEAVDAGSPPHWLAYIATPDLEATVARVSELEGNVYVAPTEIPTVGSFAVLADPQGAVFAAFTPLGEAPGHNDPPNVGEFSWNELITTDHEAAFDFYSDLFGWVKGETMDMGDAGMYQMYTRGTFPLGGMFNKTDDMPIPPMWLFYIRVGDVNETAPRIERLGGKITIGPMEVPGGDLIVQATDPQGAMFALHSTK
ncbi:MAG: VOC family protein [Gemmatimonadales bacterium]